MGRVVLLLVGFVGGLLTGISPCILPVLPVVFFGGATPGSTGQATARARPFLVVLGLTISFAAFTLFGTFLLSLLHLPSDAIRWAGLVVLVLLGLAMLIPSLEGLLERPFSRIPQRQVRPRGSGLLLGIALGAVFVPCAGPVLAAITVAGATGTFGIGTLGLTLAFAVGTAIPLLVFALAGQRLTTRLRAFRKRQRLVRSISGVVMIGLALALTFNLTDLLQTAIPNYTEALGDSLQKTVQTAQQPAEQAGHGSLKTCQTAAYSGAGTGLADCGPAPAFTGISDWINTADGKPVTLASLKGKVVLVDFWAYSCINCQRELPHVEAWAKAYAKAGFVVVGVHTPEYAFEHVAANVAAGTKRLGLTFPVAVDDAYGTWTAYDNESWPASYLIATGTIRHVSVGEGEYPRQEANIRQLLTAADPKVALPKATALPDTTPADAAQTPETYLGTERAQYYSGSDDYTAGTRRYAFSGTTQADTFQLAGAWTLGAESITAGSGAAIRLSYHASKAYLDVGGTGTLRVTDGSTTRTIHVSGAPDISTVVSHAAATAGTVTVTLSRGLTAYSYTFG